MLTKASNNKLNLPGWQRKMIISITALDAIVFCVATLQNLPPSHKGQRVTKFCNVMLDFSQPVKNQVLARGLLENLNPTTLAPVIF